MYPLSDVCFTVHVILKVSNNTVQPSPITRLRGVKDFYFFFKSVYSLITLKY